MSEAHEDWELGELVGALDAIYGTGVAEDELKGLERDQVVQEFLDDALDAYGEREKAMDELQEGLMRDLERFIVLQVVDTRWREHLESMDYMREGIGLRGLAQKDPLVEYRNEGAIMFQDLNRSIREEVVTLLFHAEVTAEDGTHAALPPPASPNGSGGNGLSYEHQSLAGSEAILAAGGTSTAAAGFASAGGVATPFAPKPKVNSEFENVGRNDLCPCGSGKKFKKCHGA
jgi:preprotein translocase subunit SecA